jgi:hypothetical protein
MRPLGSSASSRPSDIESSCLTRAPWSQASASRTSPPTRSKATGHAGTAPPMLTVGRQAQRIPFLRAPHGPSLLLAPPPSRRAPRLPSILGRSTPADRLLQGPHVSKVHKCSHGVVPRLDIIIITIIVITLLRGCLRGGLLRRETLEPLLPTSLIQRLTLEDLPFAPLLHDIFLSFLLSHRKASHLSSRAILRDWWRRVLDR